MNGKHLATLEYDKIIEQLVAHTAFSASGDLAAELLPSYDRNEVERRLQETTEAKALLATHASVTVGGAHDVRGLARRAALTARLQPQELLDIRTTLVSARSLRYLFMRVADECPLLADKAALIQPLSTVIDEIGRCLDDEGQVQDDASPKLARLRRERNLTYILVSHNLAVVSHMCERLAVMNHGNIVEELTETQLKEGTPEHPYTRQLLTASLGYDRSAVDTFEDFPE